LVGDVVIVRLSKMWWLRDTILRAHVFAVKMLGVYRPPAVIV
jgi:hypothetical protein